MNITVQIKTIYGNKTIYPVCETAKALAALTGNKTLTEHAIRIIKNMGYTIAIQAQTL